MIAELDQGPARSLYLHIPFCEMRCPYCDFAIQVGGGALQQPYVDAVVTELDWLAQAGSVPGGLETVYLGGGTPSLLEPVLLEKLLLAVQDRLGIAPGAEVTIEANPAGLTKELARSWLGLGINRLSLGVQSLDDRALAWLGRNHDGAGAEAALAAALAAGFQNVSCDLIYAVPGQSAAAFASGLVRLMRHRPQHVSCYALTVEPSTPLARAVAAGRVAGPREEDFLEQHRVAREVLEGCGLRQYEVSNYARPGSESRHNLAYWQGKHYLAAGCGAHGFLSRDGATRLGFSLTPDAVGVRYWNLRSAVTYIKRVVAQGNGRRGHEVLDPDQRQLEQLACGLRLRSGIELSGPGQLAQASRLAQLGLLAISGQQVSATPRGIEVLDRLVLELVTASPG